MQVLLHGGMATGMLALEPQAAVLGHGKLFQHSCSCSVLGGILWCEQLLPAVAELQGGWDNSHPPSGSCAHSWL